MFRPRTRTLITAVSALGLLALEVVVILLCEDLYGSVGTFGTVLYFVLVPNLLIFAICLLSSRKLGAALFLLVAFTSLSYFSFVRIRANSDQNEIELLVKIIENYKKQTGFYPEPEKFLELTPRKIKSQISEYQKQNGSFYLFYYLTTPAIGHWYSSESGWGYSDD
jgi:hypothetical protein